MFWGNDLATVLIAVVCIALLVWVTLTDANIHKLAHIRMDFAGIMQTVGIKGRYVGFTYIRPLYGFDLFWRS